MRRVLRTLAIVVGAVLLAPLLLLWVLLWLILYPLYAVALHMVLWVSCLGAGPLVLFVYSNSPVWQGYIEDHILPKLPRGSLILNWSERRRWRWSVSVAAFRFFGGRREFNPLAVVVRPFRWGRTFRFWRAFRDAKHGKPDALT